MSIFEREVSEAPNLFFAAHIAQFAAQKRIGDQISDVAEVLSSPPPEDKVSPALWAIKDRLDHLDRTIGKLDRNERDVVTALYAVALGPDGGISQHAEAGRVIQMAWHSAKLPPTSPLTICDIAKLRATPKRLDNFVRALIELKPRTGPVFEHLTEQDVVRFVRLAPSICALIEADDPPSPPPETTAS